MRNNIDIIKNFIIKLLEDKKGQNIIALDLEGKSDIAKYMIFTTGSSSKNIKSIAEHIKLELKNSHNIFVNIEGLTSPNWLLIDLGDIIVHLFHKEAREHFRLEERFTK